MTIRMTIAPRIKQSISVYGGTALVVTTGGVKTRWYSCISNSIEAAKNEAKSKMQPDVLAYDWLDFKRMGAI